MSVSHLPGDVADLGAYRGACSLILRRLRPDKYLNVFDTWEGTPYNDELCHHKIGEWKADFNECKKLVGENELTRYYPGVAESLVFYLEAKQFCFIYVDMDTYKATRYAIEFFWPRMVQGGVMMFDDYGWVPCAGVKKAVDERLGIALGRVVQSQYTCIVEKR